MRHQPNVVFLCSPNNPTGTALTLDVVEAVYDAAQDAVVVVDEAYAEFAREGTPSALTLLAGRERLVVTRTMSKAFAFAGGRLGYLAASPALTDMLRLVRLPYHLSSPTQAIALAALRHAPEMLSTVAVIKEQRDRIVAELARLGLAPVPSDANFVLFGGLADARATWQALLDRGVLVRDVGHPALSSCHGRHPRRDRCLPGRHRRDPPARGAFRMSTPDRTASLSRTTSESSVELELNLDGSGIGEVNTGVRFYDHMLLSLAKHSLIDLRVKATGDVDVDAHHTVEDVAIVLGDALRQALGDKSGISRFGDATVPLDEALVQAVVDVAGRPYVVHTGEPEGQEYVVIGGNYVGSLTRHVLESLAHHAGIALHVRVLAGRDPHHIVEAQFKAVARALRAAIARDPRVSGVPSAKGSL